MLSSCSACCFWPAPSGSHTNGVAGTGSQHAPSTQLEATQCRRSTPHTPCLLQQLVAPAQGALLLHLVGTVGVGAAAGGGGGLGLGLGGGGTGFGLGDGTGLGLGGGTGLGLGGGTGLGLGTIGTGTGLGLCLGAGRGRWRLGAGRTAAGLGLGRTGRLGRRRPADGGERGGRAKGHGMRR